MATTDTRTTKEILDSIIGKLEAHQKRSKEKVQELTSLLSDFDSALLNGQIHPFHELCDLLLQKLQNLKEATPQWNPEMNDLHYWVDEVLYDLTSQRQS